MKLGLVKLLAGLLALTGSVVSPAHADDNRQSFNVIERGRYLATAGDCIACHTSPNGKPFTGGLPIETPFGTLVSPNITPDRETGIGNWSDEDFIRAMHEGIGRHGQYLYPAFPYPSFTRVTRDDVLAIKAYLGTLDPVVNSVVSNQLSFPFNIRTSLLAWNALNFTPGEFKPDPGRSAEWNRGAYLVEGLGHCTACHTAKTLTGGDDATKRYGGGVIQTWLAPALTNDPRVGLGRWSADDIVAYLKTGHSKFGAASGPMAEVVSDSTSRMTVEDLHAMAIYLKGDRTDAISTVPAPARSNRGEDLNFAAGKNMYRASCSACHGMDGSGVPSMFPALAGSPAVQSDDATTLIRVVLQGVRSVSTPSAPTGPGMPSYNYKYSDAEVAQILNYIRSDWGNSAPVVSPDTVKTLRNTLAREGQ